jgi:hypothetical protein
MDQRLPAGGHYNKPACAGGVKTQLNKQAARVGGGYDLTAMIHAALASRSVVGPTGTGPVET